MAKTALNNQQNDLENLEFLSRVASLYYEEGMTQQRISEELGYSRSAISRFLTAARSAGVVEIRVHHPLQRDLELESRIRETFTLETVRILKGYNWEYARMLPRLGALGARLVAERVQDGMLLGVSWGTAVFEIVNALRPPYLPNLTVIQMIGALGTPDPQIDGGELARSYARAFGGRYRIFPAPALVESPQVQAAIMQERPIRDILDLARKVDIAVLGIGTTDPAMSSFVRAEYLTPKEVSEIAEAGAVGDVCAAHFDIQGNILDIDIMARVVGVSDADLMKIPFRLGVAGGAIKAPAILGALRSGLLSALVTDDLAARKVLEQI
jgi:DNA-binding transcriptional regulator LsrR (DeoR family)